MDEEVKKNISVGRYRISKLYRAVTTSPEGILRSRDTVAELPFFIDEKQAEAHLELIKEAFEVFAETGETPRELKNRLAAVPPVEVA